MAELPENSGKRGSPEPLPFQPISVQDQPETTASSTAAPASPAKSQGGKVLRVIRIVAGVGFVLVVLVVGVVAYDEWRFEHGASSNPGTGTSNDNPSGGRAITTNSTEKLTPSELGTDIYPGAVAGKVGNMHISAPSGTAISASYLTSDSMEQVIHFYKSRFGDQATSTDMGPSTIISLKKSAHEQITVTVAQDAGQAGGQTQIRIMHTTDNPAR